MTQKRILLIITGSVACYKAMEIIRLLKKKSYEVNCVLTKGAKEFITPLLVSAISGTKTYDDLFSCEDEIKMGHINLSRHNDVIVIAPTSADFIAKIANGYGDDLASCAVLARDKKIIFAPAMNSKMWDNNITQSNIDKLLQNGLLMVEPEKDLLACGEEGFGKMASPEKIVTTIDNFFANQNLLQGKNILITAGGTLEPIDPVRFIGNNSSGKQALAIAKILSERGANVSLIVGNINAKIDFATKDIFYVKNAQQMFDNVKNYLESNNNLDAFISCSAVADYRVKNYSPTKIKKSLQQNFTLENFTSENFTLENLTLELERNPDILEYVGTAPNRPRLVIGFCAESDNLLANAKEKLIRKNCDFIIANNIKNGEIFGSDFTSAIIVDKNNVEDLGNITKTQLATILADKL